MIIAAVAILILLLVVALVLVAFVVSGREDRWTVAAIVGAIGLVILCCIVTLAATAWFLFEFGPVA